MIVALQSINNVLCNHVLNICLQSFSKKSPLWLPLWIISEIKNQKNCKDDLNIQLNDTEFEDALSLLSSDFDCTSAPIPNHTLPSAYTPYIPQTVHFYTTYPGFKFLGGPSSLQLLLMPAG